MTRIIVPRLTLITVNDMVTINVSYSAIFLPLERFLAEKGLRFQERITLVAIDEHGTTDLLNFPSFNFQLSVGEGIQTIPRNVSITRSRASLQEDTGKGDTDEFKCRIDISPVNMPRNVSRLTEQEELLG